VAASGFYERAITGATFDKLIEETYVLRFTRSFYIYFRPLSLSLTLSLSLSLALPRIRMSLNLTRM